MNIHEISRRHKDYPNLLKEIAHPPKQLFYAGQPQAKGPAIAIVGSRKATAYGRGITYRLAGELAQCGLTIVSGLALGIDSIAHQATLEAGGQTLAVLGCGLDSIYPATNRQLAGRIIKQGGSIWSEYATGTPPLKHHFPARNRIIAGLSLAVIVTEAPSHSGALITANFALEANRLVMAVPGNITSQTSAGTNNLLKVGAIAVTETTDVLAALDVAVPHLKAKTVQPSSAEEAKILKLLARDITDSEELITKTGLKTAEFNQVITLMEISGKIRNLGGGKWIAC